MAGALDIMLSPRRALQLEAIAIGLFCLTALTHAGEGALEQQPSRLPSFFTAFPPGGGPGFVLRGRGLGASLRPDEIAFRVGPALIRLAFPGGNGSCRLEGVNSLAGKVNVLSGRGPKAWNLGAGAYEAVRYKDLYPGIDMVYRTSQARLKSEFIVRPGADPRLIRLRYSGARRMRLDSDGALVLQSAGSQLREAPPRIYQEIGGSSVSVAGAYRLLRDGTVGFAIAAYDRARPLVIDPDISYSTYLGGGRFDAVTSIAADGGGNVYVAGWTESGDFPALGGPQTANGGGVDAFVAKLDVSGRLVYCTYLGGTGDDRALGIAVDASGSAYVAGSTGSADFPVRNAIQQSLAGGRDAFVAKLSPNGATLVFSTYLGGSGLDSANAIALDAAGNAYVAGGTDSPNFPVAYAVQSSLAGSQDSFVAKLSETGARVFYSTYLGGSGDDQARAIAVDAAGTAYIAGGTTSGNFPLLNPLQSALRGSQDAFAAKLDPAGALAYSTYLGGSGGGAAFPETALGIAVDGAGSAYVVGTTNSQDFPTLRALQPALRGWQNDAFAARLNAAGNALIFSTYLGGSGMDAANAIALDSSGAAYISGETTSSDFPLAHAVQSVNAGSYDAFAVQLTASGDVLELGTYLGGSGSDSASSIALDGNGGVYVAGQTLSPGFPLQRALQSTNGGNFGGFVTRLKIDQATGFVPVTPCRVADTRAAVGPFGGPAMAAGQTRTFAIPASGCNIPAGARAYSLNVTVLPRGMLGYLSIWPAGQARPAVSTLNSYDGRVKANAAIVPAGANGGISVFVTDTADVLLDINGYFTDSSDTSALAFYPIMPCRVIDTRGAVGPLGGPSLQAAQTRLVPVASSTCGIPLGARAYSLNVTAVPHGRLSYLSTWPAGSPFPGVSTLNAFTGAVTANAAVVPAGTNGAIALYATDATDVIVDVNGYFAPPTQGGLWFYAVTPCRVLDTRWAPGPLGGPSLAGARDFPLSSGSCGLPAANVHSLNVTVLPRQSLGYLTVWAVGTAQPLASTLNSIDGSVTANAAIVPATDGKISAFAAGATELIVDVNGYFAP